MLSSASYLLHHSHRRPLAASAIALFAVSTTSAWAVPPAVTNCNDSGAGSLRYAVDPVNGAVSGDTIDMSGLGCSTITLTTGAIVVGQKILTIQGKEDPTGLSINQTSPNSRVIVHNYAGSSGHLYLQDLLVGYGYVSGSGTIHGGCIASLSGALTLNRVGVYHCGVTTTGMSTDYPVPNAFGGGVFAAAGLSILHSAILHSSTAAPQAGVRSQGGCAMTFGSFNMIDSSIAYCYAMGPNTRVRGGALELRGDSIVIGSVIGKSVANFIGGVDFNAPGNTPAHSATMSNSTVTLNSANVWIGGVYANTAIVNINNSTITSNKAGSYTYTYNANTYNAAVGVSLASVGATVSLQSTIIANNTISGSGTQEDLSFGASKNVTFSASNNLVRAYLSDVTLPSGQGNLPKGTCPKLGHVRNNGGVTYTLALQSGSPAVDAGNNTANDPRTGMPAAYDQRDGPPPPPVAQPPDGYPRVSGPSADIGAYEMQKADIIFYTEMETGCD
jgi:hypothetical protein